MKFKDRWSEPLGTPFKFEYRCISQKDEIVVEGEFVIALQCTITSPRLRSTGAFAMMDKEHETLSNYKGVNHLKTVEMKVTNLITRNTRLVISSNL